VHVHLGLTTEPCKLSKHALGKQRMKTLYQLQLVWCLLYDCN
jgi:hypothetical protein